MVATWPAISYHEASSAPLNSLFYTPLYCSISSRRPRSENLASRNKMAGSGSNGITEPPSERTSLLSKDAINPSEPSLRQDGNANGNGHGGVGDSSKGGGNDDSVIDEENGEIEGAANPLFEGNAEMAKKMHLLFPAVAIGVSSSLILVEKHDGRRF